MIQVYDNYPILLLQSSRNFQSNFTFINLLRKNKKIKSINDLLSEHAKDELKFEELFSKQECEEMKGCVELLPRISVDIDIGISGEEDKTKAKIIRVGDIFTIKVKINRLHIKKNQVCTLQYKL
jgi:hypothetical protein